MNVIDYDGEQYIPKAAADHTINAALERIQGLTYEVVDLTANLSANQTLIQKLREQAADSEAYGARMARRVRELETRLEELGEQVDDE